ncbi:DUF6597 domain-containing transcriptional factor [Microbacterium elymi]|uniref:DUF6597 domain-containing protein n=1 Tax=Microbacterium elymi TaxID=2909587 RepID=A0ABY5NKI8_9MICO|nr:hypothetical protein [Microbacterium elymi]UUT35591.1 hypothetical protein L2X98_19995 [Microbacterium elymi]
MAWFWVPEWDLPPGAASTQEVLAYPAANLVVSPDDVRLWGAATRRTERVLTGTAWAVGALLGRRRWRPSLRSPCAWSTAPSRSRLRNWWRASAPSCRVGRPQHPLAWVPG